jgi:hypothetical protein
LVTTASFSASAYDTALFVHVSPRGRSLLLHAPLPPWSPTTTGRSTAASTSYRRKGNKVKWQNPKAPFRIDEVGLGPVIPLDPATVVVLTRGSTKAPMSRLAHHPCVAGISIANLSKNTTTSKCGLSKIAQNISKTTCFAPQQHSISCSCSCTI